jgi:hypothetical protein
MDRLINALIYLKQNPIIGVASGFSSGIILTIEGFLVDETILRLVAATGVWMGAMVAFLTLSLKAIQLLKELFYYFKLKKK